MVNKRSRDARTQLHVWNRLLEGRIAIQKVVTSIRDLEKLHEPPKDKQGQDEQHDAEESTQHPTIVGADEKTIESISKLLKCLVRVRECYRAKSQFCTEDQDVISDDCPMPDVDDDLLNKKHEHYAKLRSDTIEKWCDKTKIGTIPKKGYVAMELPTLQLVSNAMKDKQRLIKRTQLDRTSHLDNQFHPETFNDDDFYHLLLKQLISREENRNWVELQRTRYKNKRKADTKATKGRKIKKDLVPKLVNFMAPWTPANMHHKDTTIPEQIRTELLKSLFGGSVVHRGVS